MPSVTFDVRQYGWLGSMSIASSICAVSGSAVNFSAKDLFDKEVVVGGTAGSPTIVPALLNNLAGTRFNVIQRYPSTAAVLLAMQNGELNGVCGWSWDGARVNGKDLFGRGVLRVLLDIAIEPQAELRDMKVPFLMDLVPEGENKEILKVVLSSQIYNRP